MKIRILYKYEGAQSCELGFAILPVRTTVKDAARIKEHVIGMMIIKLTIKIKKRRKQISLIEKQLTMWIEACMFLANVVVM
jgi:glutamate racemase